MLPSIYLDHHATTPLDEDVFEAMKPYFMEDFGNAASRNHIYGWRAEKAVEIARGQVAKVIGAHSREITFTSGATESNNLALLGIAESYKEKGRHIITTQVEHKSILDVCRELETRGFKVTYLPVDCYGQVSMDSLKSALTNETILVSIQMANNEVGTIQPLQKIGALLKEKEIFFHSDITQGVSTLPVHVDTLHLDFASFSSHKIYGPKGVGALYMRHQSPRIKLKPLIFGGGHEKGLRSGTLNVPGIVGFGKACEMISPRRGQDFENLKAMRDELEAELKKHYGATIHGHPGERLPHNLNFSLDFIEDVTAFLKDVHQLALSTSAACSVNSIEPSHVLLAMGIDEKRIAQTLRIGLGRINSREQIDFIVKAWRPMDKTPESTYNRGMITVTEKAANEVKRILSQKGETESFLRVQVVGGGCSGMSYKLDFDKSKKDNDKIFEEHGIKIVVDPKSYLYIMNTTLDFSDGLQGTGFNFSNPNAKKSCGCGSSFAV